MKCNEQVLIDIIFEIAFMIRDKEFKSMFKKMSREEFARWIQKQLSNAGFIIVPTGSSWGVLQRITRS